MSSPVLPLKQKAFVRAAAVLDDIDTYTIYYEGYFPHQTARF